jgi:hypothetical protein
VHVDAASELRAGAQLLVSIPQFYSVTRSCSGEQMTVVENQVT